MKIGDSVSGGGFSIFILQSSFINCLSPCLSGELVFRYNNPMLMEADKVMFEIYRETAYTGKYRVVYFTELNEANKEYEINRAMSGEHFYDGFIRNFRKEEAKDRIDALLKRLNEGERLTPADIERELAPYTPEPTN